MPSSFSRLRVRLLATPLMLSCVVWNFAYAQTPSHEELSALQTSGGTLYGTLFLPDNMATVAVPTALVILHSGSGPTDRDGNSALMTAHNDGLRQLAQTLAARGIASLRYDKRGVGESRAAMSSEQDLRFDTYVEDLAAWVRELRHDSRFSKIVLAGHSEGALIGMLAAQRVSVDGYISLAGPSQRASDVLREQTRRQVTDGQFAVFDKALSEVEAGQPPHAPPTEPPFLARMFRLSVLPYLGSWIGRDPAAEIRKLTVPILIVQGALDEMVPPKSARELKQVRPEATLVMVANMHHTLKEAPATSDGQRRAWSDPTTPLPAALVDAMVVFVDGISSSGKTPQ